MNSLLALTVIACLAQYAFTQKQHTVSRRQASQYCVTPDNYYGSCVALNYCPQVVNVFRNQPQNVAQRYVISLQRSCGTRNINGDPVICCTRPSQQSFQTTRPPQQPVSRPANPFFPTQGPFEQSTNRNPQNPFLTTRPTTRAPTRTTTQAPTTSSPLIDNRVSDCRGPDTREGTCMSLEKCEELLNELLRKQQDATFANYLRASNRICGGTSSNVCCPSKGTPNNPTTPAGPTRAAFTNAVPRRLPTVEEGCGYTNTPFKKIVGGEVAKPGAWPWAVLLGYDDGLSNSPFKCGGALVTARHVVTAAHCIRKDLTFVRLGEHDLSTDRETKHVDIKIARQESHPQYNKRNGRSDIAILYLERNVEFSNSISPICLPTTESLRRKNYEQYNPFVVGWGKTMEGGTSATVLQELQIPIYDNQVCRDSYQRQNRLISQDQFDEAVICAGVLTGGKDTCQGDSGGPLMIPESYGNSVRYYLIGVVSYGIGCARPNVPGVYTSTQYFIDWIIEKVADSR